MLEVSYKLFQPGYSILEENNMIMRSRASFLVDSTILACSPGFLTALTWICPRTLKLYRKMAVKSQFLVSFRPFCAISHLICGCILFCFVCLFRGFELSRLNRPRPVIPTKSDSEPTFLS